MEGAFQFTVNGKPVRVVTDGDRPLLDVIREDLALTGTKYGCGEGECGACTVLTDGLAIRSCITTVADADGLNLQTIEGLAPDDKLHAVQQAFIEKDAMQCGYCVPGQIMNAVGFLQKNARPTRDEIVEGMSGNICRCCNYVNILAAIERAAELGNSRAESPASGQ
jgi:aerobic-type carbon monoxide dehydrogenase small subunit (CoxS/CutS family)